MHISFQTYRTNMPDHTISSYFLYGSEGFNNVRLYIGLVQERHGSIGRSRLVGLHYRLGGPESAQCALGSRAAPIHRMPSSRPGDPIWNIGDWR